MSVRTRPRPTQKALLHAEQAASLDIMDLPPVIHLVRTAPPEQSGSMSAYTRMVMDAVATARSGPFRFEILDAYGGGTQDGMWRQHAWRLRHMGRTLRARPEGVFHLLDGSMAAFVPSSVRARTLVMVHDLIPWLQLRGELPGRPSLPAAMLVRRARAVWRRCAGLCVDSECTRNDLGRGGAEATVIPLAVRPLEGDGSGMDPLPEPFLLHVGHNAAYKNRAGALDVFARLRDRGDLHLVMAGPDPDPALRRRAEALGRVRFLTNVSDAHLGALYAQATVFLFPSLYEGFGMPVLEAMAAGCPVVCSDGGALPEVAGDAAFIAPVNDVAGLAGHCRRLLEDGAARDRLRIRGRARAAEFTLQRMGAELMAWYQHIWPRMNGGHACIS